MFNEILKKIQDHHGIKNSEIVEIADIQATQLSEYRKGKSDISSRKLWSILQALDTINPAAKADFAAEIANFEDVEPILDPVGLVDSWSEEELNQILLAVANRYRKEKQSLLSTSTERNKLKTAV
jgi:transcriptional regulator with XRE-family HTH domain